jgi:hypothetical protein
MKYVGFSFKKEAIWMLGLSLAPVLIGTLILLAVLILRRS